MRDYRRITPILERIRSMWHKYPDLRLMQLMDIVIGHSGDHFNLEDDDFDRRLRARMRDWEVQLELPVEEGTDV